jgi:hypothetical protein
VPPPAGPPPVITPVDGAATAMVVLLLLHVPPEGVLFRVVLPFAQNVVVPVIEDGKGLIVAIAVVKHPPANV